MSFEHIQLPQPSASYPLISPIFSYPTWQLLLSFPIKYRLCCPPSLGIAAFYGVWSVYKGSHQKQNKTQNNPKTNKCFSPCSNQVLSP